MAENKGAPRKEGKKPVRYPDDVSFCPLDLCYDCDKISPGILQIKKQHNGIY